jgi:hypothetical protein
VVPVQILKWPLGIFLSFLFSDKFLNHGPIRKKKQEKYFLANKHLPEELAFKVMGIGPFQIQISLYNRECEFIRIFLAQRTATDRL